MAAQRKNVRIDYSVRIHQVDPSLVDRVSRIASDVRKRQRRRLPTKSSVYESTEVEDTRKVSILTWNVSHNALGRAYLLADALRFDYDVELIAPSFSKFGEDVWSPLRSCSRVKIRHYSGVGFPLHFHHLEYMVKQVTGDAIYVSKPRLPGLELAILAKLERNRPIILDVDDYEAGFFKNRDPITLEGVKAQQQSSEFNCPYGELWTRYSESLICQFDGLTVPNKQLQDRYGGIVLPHMRDEIDFRSADYPREEIRKILGFRRGDRVILFAGTPRAHKGIRQVIQALEKLQEPSYKLLLIGSPLDKSTLSYLHGNEMSFLHAFESVRFSDLPAYLSASDLICLVQNKEGVASEYQTPAKFTDGLSMEVPMIASNVPVFCRLGKGRTGGAAW